ncbi:alpha/beta hydrolase [Brevundimonas sp. SL130]|uniref:alpha/beta hydrolase n=1 Tax=Brevundimonas sp. SL130 TaxID=2995143 RepID=UPI00226CEF31|nr:alpha/beta hydrolase [Brevundimonas sp. SL130]WAC60531.1 alpha/beta hydrolase [Brevundimonas sp. SL130]
MKIERRSLLGLAAVAAAGAARPALACQAVGAPSASALAPPDPAEVIRLWPNGAPGGEGVSVTPIVPERSTDPAFHDRYAQYTTDPILTVFRPERPNGSALLLIPGGGYRWAVLDKEGYDVARVFAASGTTCFVLRYRLPADGWAAGADAPLQDAQRALRLIRSRSADYGVNPAKIGVLGASAGGHLAGLASVRTDATYDPVDASDTVSLRPDLTVLMYPVATMADPFVHAGSRAHLLGDAPSAERVAAYSLERMDWTGAAPVFLLHAMDDGAVPVENSLLLLSKLKAAGVPAEAHLFQEGGHGFGVRLIRGRPAEVWPDLVRAWGRRLDFAL